MHSEAPAPSKTVFLFSRRFTVQVAETEIDIETGITEERSSGSRDRES